MQVRALLGHVHARSRNARECIDCVNVAPVHQRARPCILGLRLALLINYRAPLLCNGGCIARPCIIIHGARLPWRHWRINRRGSFDVRERSRWISLSGRSGFRRAKKTNRSRSVRRGIWISAKSFSSWAETPKTFNSLIILSSPSDSGWNLSPPWSSIPERTETQPWLLSDFNLIPEFREESGNTNVDGCRTLTLATVVTTQRLF